MLTILKAGSGDLQDETTTVDLGVQGQGQHHTFREAGDDTSPTSSNRLSAGDHMGQTQLYTLNSSHQRPQVLDGPVVAEVDTFGIVPPFFYDAGVQHVRSIETLDQFNVQLCGNSAELDPWLLRHCRFDDVGMRQHGKIRIRNVGGVPIDDMIPVHFTVVDDNFYDVAKPQQGSAPSLHNPRRELDSLVSPDMGRRLITLYVIPYYQYARPQFCYWSLTRTADISNSSSQNFLSSRVTEQTYSHRTPTSHLPVFRWSCLLQSTHVLFLSRSMTRLFSSPSPLRGVRSMRFGAWFTDSSWKICIDPS
jgi:hypothetical protein